MMAGVSPSSSPQWVSRLSCPCCRAPESVVLRESAYTAPELVSFLDELYSRQGGVEHEYLEDVRYVLRRCPECGLVFQQYAPAGPLAERLYEGWIDPEKSYEVFERHRNVECFFPPLREIADVIRHFGGEPQGLQLLDFGAGWAHWARLARGYGCEVAVTELAPSRREAAHLAGLRVLHPSELPSGMFHYINAEQVFEHLPEPLETLQRLTRSLRPEGVILISVPDGWQIERRIQRWDWSAPEGSRWSLIPVAPLEHVNCFSRGSLTRLGSLAGLRPVKITEHYRFGPRAGPLAAAAADLRRVLRPLRPSLAPGTSLRVFLGRAPEGR
jgi:SAM-dependent methyltransferase